MSSLTGQLPKNTYKDLLQVSNNNAGVDNTLRRVEDGEGTQSALLLSQTAARIAGQLDFSGTDHPGLVLNKLSTAQRDALDPVRGMLIHNTTTDRMEEYNGTDWVAGGGGSGSVTLSGDVSGSGTGTIGVTVTKLNGSDIADVATTGSYADLTDTPTLGTAAGYDASQFLTPTGSAAGLSAFGASGVGHAKGVVPDPGASSGTAKFLREDATWATPTARTSRVPTLTVATCGDSYAAIGFTNSSTVKDYANENLLHWLRCYLGGRIHMPLANNLAVGATDAATAVASIPSVLALNPDIVFLSTGRNNLQGGAYTWQQVANIVLPGVATMLNAGVDVLWLPVIQHSFGFSLVDYRQNLACYNRLIYEICSGLRPDLVTAYGFPSGRLPMTIDMRFMNDNATGYNLADYVLNDNTHGTARLWFDAVYRTGGLGQAFDRLLPPRTTHACVFDDIYHATRFPTGNLINNGTVNDGLLAGTSGSKLTNAGVTPSGSVATRWQALRAQGDSTATMACSKESPRTDGLSGERQIVEINVSSPGTVFAEIYYLTYLGPSSLNITSGFAPGDTVYMHANYEILEAPTGFLGAAIRLAESGNASNQTTRDGSAGTGTLARGPGIAYKGTLRTPPIVLGAATNKLVPYLYLWARGDTTSAVKIAWGDVAVRKA